MRKIRKTGASIIALIVLAAVLTGCGENMQSVMNMMQSKLGGIVKVNRTVTDKSKWINSSIDGAIDDTLDISEKDDFYTAVNKEWILNTKLDEETNSAGRLLDNADLVNERIDDLISKCTELDQLEGSNRVDMPEEQYLHTQKLLGQFAAALEDREGRNEEGIEPARAYIEAIEDIESMQQLTEYIENKNGRNFAMLNLVPVRMEIPRSEHDSYTVYLGQNPSYVFTSADSYFSISVTDTAVKEIIVEYVKPLLIELGYSGREAGQIIRNCFRLEGQLAEGMNLGNQNIDSMEKYKQLDHFYTYEELKELQGEYPLTEILDAWELGAAEKINIENVDYVRKVGRLYSEKNLTKLKDYLIVNTLISMLPYMDQTSYEIFDMLYRVKTESDTSLDEDTLVRTYIESDMSEILQEVYIGQYCDAKQKQELSSMIDESIDYYRSMLKQEEWLTEETREKAIEKLDHIIYRVLYPDQMTDYTSLKFEEEDTLIDMVARLNQFKNSQLKNKVNKEVDRHDWDLGGMSTLAVNAYYMPTDNSINILAGILANGFVYDENAREEKNLARIGMIVGHEITHGFDTNGYLYDKDGIPNKWWTYEDEEQFQIRAGHLAKYFSTLSPFPDGGAYNGDLVKEEATADMGGLKCMLGIARDREDFDYDLFFTSYAELWASKNTLAYEIMLVGDEHPLDCFRVNVVLQQFDEFMETYDIQPGDGMYLSPENRVAVW